MTRAGSPCWRWVSLFGAVVVAVAGASSVMFFAQGGFGGGRGGLDTPIYMLAMPWVLIPWHSIVTTSDFVRLTAIPFICNATVFTLACFVFRSRLRRGNPAVRAKRSE